MRELHTLKNGVTVILEPDNNAGVVTVAVGVNIGANHEEEDEHGLAHFFEHMCFKGTETYPSYVELLQRFTKLGLASNAYTGREYTVYYLSGRTERLQDMMDLTADIFLRSLFPAEEIEKEKGVVAEEIKMYNDDPSSKVNDLVRMSLFSNTTVEHSILGTPESVRSFNRDKFMGFLKKHYVTGNTIISISGNIDSPETLSALETLYADMPTGDHTDHSEVFVSGVKRRHMYEKRSDVDQTNIVIGGYSPATEDPDRYASKVFSTLLGGSMSSRLFMRVREHLGACYSISAYTSGSPHYGRFGIHTGINGERTDEVMDAIVRECVAMKGEPVPQEEVDDVRELLLGRRALGNDGSISDAHRNITHYACEKELPPDDEEYERLLNAVTSEDVHRVANRVFVPENMAVGYIGKHDVSEKTTETFLNAL